jgi:hypothetical protein
VKVFYDTEFLEDGRTIDLISIGMVAEDGREFYGINRAAPWRRIAQHPWLMANVVPSLPRTVATTIRVVGNPHLQPRILHTPAKVDLLDPSVMYPDVLAEQVGAFLQSCLPRLELWAWYGAYDHVALAQLWGPMVDLPKGIPMYTHDLKQEVDRLGNPELPGQPAGEHHALADALHLKDRYAWLIDWEARGGWDAPPKDPGDPPVTWPVP